MECRVRFPDARKQETPVQIRLKREHALSSRSRALATVARTEIWQTEAVATVDAPVKNWQLRAVAQRKSVSFMVQVHAARNNGDHKMSEQKILPCRICGSESTERADKLGFFVESYCKHQICGPTMPTREEAISEWNKMMQPQVFAKVKSIGTSYRDRVDRMVVALLDWDRHEPTIIKRAISLVDEIDAELAKREAMK